MKRDDALHRLRASEPSLRAKGARSLYLFGSTARDEARPGSDVDILLDVNDDENFSLLDLIEFRDFVADLLRAKIDIIEGLDRKTLFRDRIAQDLLKVF